MTLISIILAPNSRYTFDVLDFQERGVFYIGGDLLAIITETVKNPGRGARYLCLTPFIRLGKVLHDKQILRFSLFLMSHQVLFLCERRINFLHFKMPSSFLHYFPLFKS